MSEVIRYRTKPVIPNQGQFCIPFPIGDICQCLETLVNVWRHSGVSHDCEGRRMVSLLVSGG